MGLVHLRAAPAHVGGGGGGGGRSGCSAARVVGRLVELVGGRVAGRWSEEPFACRSILGRGRLLPASDGRRMRRTGWSENLEWTAGGKAAAGRKRRGKRGGVGFC